MSWAVGWDSTWQRDIGYGVPSICDHPKCDKEIDRGLAFVCGGHPYGGDKGCGLFFCGDHLWTMIGRGVQLCTRCKNYSPPYKAKPDRPQWIRHKLKHASWKRWRAENADEVKALTEALKVLKKQNARSASRGLRI